MAKKKLVKKAKKIKKLKKYNLDARIKNALRRVWLWSPTRREVIKRCKIDVNTSRCEKCRKLCDKIQVDHMEPVVPPETGFDDWNGYLFRLFIDAGKLQGLCYECHLKKTLNEQQVRLNARRTNK